MTLRRAVLEVRRATARLAAVSPLRLLTDHGRALGLHLRGPDRFRPAPGGRATRLVVTLSTTPRRAKRLLPTLRSLIDQTVAADRIVLALPRVSRRDGSLYPQARELALPEGIDVLACDDEGPITKLLPTLACEPDACLVVVDDDVIYPRDFLATLLAAHGLAPRAVVGYRGVVLEPGVAFRDLAHVFATGVRVPRPIDVVFGTWGYLVPPGALDGAVADFSGRPEGVRNVDDVWISGHLARRGVERLVVPAPMYPIEGLATFAGSLTGGVNRSGENDGLAVALFSEDWRSTRRSDALVGDDPC